MSGRATIRRSLTIYFHVRHSRHEIIRFIKIRPFNLLLINHLIFFGHLISVSRWYNSALHNKLPLCDWLRGGSDNVVIGGCAPSFEGRILIDLFVILDVHFVELLLQQTHLLLEMVDVPLLVSALLGVGRGSHEVLESYRIPRILRPIWVRIRSRQEPLPFQEVNPVESVIAPAFTHFEIGWELSDYLQALWITVVKHFNSVLVFRCLT